MLPWDGTRINRMVGLEMGLRVSQAKSFAVTHSFHTVHLSSYRNFLMACTALIDQQVQPFYFPALDEPVPPGVRNLQLWIETAWEAGAV